MKINVLPTKEELDKLFYYAEAGDYSKTHGLRKTTLQRIIIEQYEGAINEN